MSCDENRPEESSKPRAAALPADSRFVPPVSPGQILLEKYRIESLIGTGGIGFVMSATNVGLDEKVALKFLRPDFLTNEEAVRRFTNEARLAAKIQSPHVARVLDIANADGVGPFIVMELLVGRDLNQILFEEGRMPIERAVDYVLQACEALSAAHACNIIHRDVKPDNLFLARQQQGPDIIKILDFGISKQQIDRSSGIRNPALFQTMTALGSPSYMSPEQIRASADIDGRADVWSLGCVLYELIAAKHAFDAPTLMQVCAVVLERQPTPIREQVPDVPEELEAIILRCLEKSPDDRFESVRELAQALAPFAPPAARPTPLPPSRLRTTASAASVPPPPVAEVRSPPSTAPMALDWEPSKKRGSIARPPLHEIVAYGALAACIGIGGGLLVRSQGPSANSTPKVQSAVTADRATASAEVKPTPVAVESLPTSAAPSDDSARSRAKKAPSYRAAPVLGEPPLSEPVASIAEAEANEAEPSATPSAPESRPSAEAAFPLGSDAAAPLAERTDELRAPSTTATSAETAPKANAPRPSAPSVPAPANSGPGKLSASVVSSVVRTHTADIHACFDRNHADYDSNKGRIAIEATLDRLGNVIDARPASSVEDNPRLGVCLVAAVRHWRFPARPDAARLTAYRLLLE